MRVISCILLTAALLFMEGSSQRSERGGKDKIMFADNVCLPKGGLGIINKNLYIVLESTKNELILGEGERWTGHDLPTPQVAVVFEGRVWSQQALPHGFDLGKAIVVSFESDKVRFFDFRKMSGGYYERQRKH